MTILILLVLIALLWMAVLAPSAWRRFRERQGVESIDHFHHQLQLLEHAGPKTVAPAFRLYTAVPGAGPASPAPAGVDSSRPKLVLLRPTDDEAAADVDDSEGLHYERVGVLDRPDPVCVPDVTDVAVYRREEARHRCTVLLRCLIGLSITTGLFGLFPGMHLAWVFTGLAGLAALGLVGLIAYAKEIEAQQQQRRSEIRRFVNPATAGYPGAWDDRFEDDRFDDGFGSQAVAR